MAYEIYPNIEGQVNNMLAMKLTANGVGDTSMWKIKIVSTWDNIGVHAHARVAIEVRYDFLNESGQYHKKRELVRQVCYDLSKLGILTTFTVDYNKEGE